MPKKKEEEEAGAPLWMVTMSDMNTLLMTFFVIMFSMMTQDKPLYMNLRKIFQQMSKWANPEVEGPNPRDPNLSLDPMGRERGADDDAASRQEIPRPKSVDVRITKRASQLVIHLDGTAGYDRGTYHLSERQKAVLDWVKQVKVKGYLHNIIVRGFTERHPLDAYVLEESSGVSLLRPAREADDESVRDPFLLSSLRAQAVRYYLIYGDDGINPGQVRLGEFAHEGSATEETGGEENRRVEIILTNRRTDRSQ